MVEGEDTGLRMELDDSFPMKPPGGVLPLGHNDNGASCILADFLKESVELGPGRVDVGGDLVPSVGKRVTSKGVGVVGIRGEVGGKLVMLRGGEDIGGWVEVEVVADVVEDDGVEHDIFVCSSGIVELWHGECDALGERRDGASAESGLEFGWAGVVVAGNQRITRLWWTRTRTWWWGVVGLGKSR